MLLNLLSLNILLPIKFIFLILALFPKSILNVRSILLSDFSISSISISASNNPCLLKMSITFVYLLAK